MRRPQVALRLSLRFIVSVPLFDPLRFQFSGVWLRSRASSTSLQKQVSFHGGLAGKSLNPKPNGRAAQVWLGRSGPGCAIPVRGWPSCGNHGGVTVAMEKSFRKGEYIAEAAKRQWGLMCLRERERTDGLALKWKRA